jgi:hypothetical protein
LQIMIVCGDSAAGCDALLDRASERALGDQPTGWPNEL